MGLLKKIFCSANNSEKNNVNLNNDKEIISSIDQVSEINKELNAIKGKSNDEEKTYCLPSLDLLDANSLKELRPFINNMKQSNELSIPIGKYNNDVLIENICNMPNLLIGGTIMSGKSTYINFILISMLLTRNPNDLKLIIFDSKAVEYSQYNGIPHLLMPVISDEKRLSISLSKVSSEISLRYDLLKNSCKKSIRQYNNDIKNNKAKIPDLVIIIDSYSDLNITNEINGHLEYISKNGWNVNVYLIVIANHPSSTVISTVSKSNFPARISFRVTSKRDSMIILDKPGAEKIDEIGTALYKSSSNNILKTVKIPIINDEAIERIINWIINQQEAIYDEKFQVTPEGQGSAANNLNEEYEDPLYNDIVEYVVTTGRTSASLLQRRFKIGYNRAARIIDLLEARGVIGSQNGSQPREVLATFTNDERR